MKQKKQINAFLVETFNEVLKSEEIFLNKEFPDISVTEMHVIEAVYNVNKEQGDNRSTMIAERLKVTAGTLTTSVAQLERKGYVQRIRDDKDKRIVHLIPTDKGTLAQQCHMEFHDQLVDSALATLNEEESAVLIKALNSITGFIKEAYKEK